MPKKRATVYMSDRVARRVPPRAIACPHCGLPEAVCTVRDEDARYYRCRVCGHRWKGVA